MPAVPMFRCYVLDREYRIQSRTDTEARSLGEAINRVREEIELSKRAANVCHLRFGRVHSGCIPSGGTTAWKSL